MYVCMYVCMYTVCKYVYMYVYMYVCLQGELLSLLLAVTLQPSMYISSSASKEFVIARDTLWLALGPVLIRCYSHTTSYLISPVTIKCIVGSGLTKVYLPTARGASLSG